MQQAEEKGKLFRKNIGSHPNVIEVRGKGLMLAVEIKERSYMDKLFANFLENRLIVDRFLFSDNSFRIAPPLIIDNDQIEETCNSILKSLDNL
jgi:4-aminobutyrate aminotransferase-like enzyme